MATWKALEKLDRDRNFNKTSIVKNKQPAAIQITAEQILREAKDRQDKPIPRAVQTIVDKEELDEYQLIKRREFENTVRRNRMATGAWLNYAKWEEVQKEYARSRSVFERALDFDPRSHVLWLRYCEMEMRLKNVNRARNILNRAVSILPRVDMFWYKFTYMEEMLLNITGARQVFDRWMEWEPTEDAYMAFVKFELRYNEFDLARKVYQRFVTAFPLTKNWLKWAKFEEQNNNIDMARHIYEQCLETLGQELIDQNVYISFAKFESRNKEIDRARVIYKYALDKLPDGQKENLYNAYTQFEKQFGGKEGLEDVVISKRRVHYEDEIDKNSFNYDLWFDYLRLEESHGVAEKIREIYERAVANVPPINEKQHWSRYVYLWIYYAVWEELDCGNMERARKVYLSCIKLIPNKEFTFAKVWLFYAKFLIRNGELDTARKTLGMAIGKHPKEKLFKEYIELELSLREFDRARTLYEKYLEWNSANCYAWIKFAELEKMLGESARARGIYEIAIGQDQLDMPEVLWKSFIDFEVQEQEYENARGLYKRLLERTRHVKVYIAFASFETEALDFSEKDRIERADLVFKSAPQQELSKEERHQLLEAWLDFRQKQGLDAEEIQAMMPQVVKKRRRLESGGWQEYFDHVFPQDESEKPNIKLLELAHQWKSQAAEDSEDSE